MRRFVLILCALALVGSACGGRTGSSADRPDATTSTSLASRPATTRPGSGPETTIDLQAAAIREQIDELIVEAQQIRDLTFLEPVNVILLNDAEYQARIVELLNEELTDEEVDSQTALFRLLGVIGPEDDLRDTYDTLYSTGTGGFYDQDTGELVVRLADDGLGPQASAVVVHELTHALQDQHFDLLARRDDLEGDQYYVATAIIEGDALLRELTYVENLSPSDQREWTREYAAALAEVEAIQASLPGYLVNSLQAPYLDGFFFHQRFGVGRVDDLFNNLPESSEQILDFEKYEEDEQPVEVVLPELELEGYEVYFDDSMGQKDFQLLLGEAMDLKQAEEAAVGWGGDTARIYTSGNSEAVFVVSFRGDSKADATELGAAFSEYEAVMVPSGGFSFVRADGLDLLVIFASDAGLGSELLAAFAA